MPITKALPEVLQAELAVWKSQQWIECKRPANPS
jgi:hypothetical protein